MWNADHNAFLNTFAGHSSTVTCGDFTPDGTEPFSLVLFNFMHVNVNKLPPNMVQNISPQSTLLSPVFFGTSPMECFTCM